MIFIISVCGQILIVQHGGEAFQTVPLEKDMWFLSIFIGSISIPIGAVIRYLPDDLFKKKQSLYSTETIKTIQPVIDNQKNQNIAYNENYEPIHWSIKIT